MIESLKELVCMQENKSIIFLNALNGCWVKMPQNTYQKWTRTERAGRKLAEYLQERYQLFQQPDEHPDVLQSVYWAVTGSCNMKCGFCTMNASPDVNQNNDLTLEEIHRILIPNLLELAPKKLVLTGGEPFKRSDIHNILKMIEENFYLERITLQTNGLLMTVNDVHQIVKYIGAIEFSVENLFPESEELCKMRLIFDACRETGLMMSFSFVASDLTTRYIKKALDLCHEYQATFALRIVSMLGRAKENHNKDEINEEDCKLKLYIEILRYILKKGYFEEQMVNIFLFTPQIRRNCGAFGNICAIRPDGQVYMCQNFKFDRYLLGNIRTDTIQNVKKELLYRLQSDSFIEEFRVWRPTVCEECKVKFFCSGPCAAELAENRPVEPDRCSIKKELLRFNLFYKDRRKTIKENLEMLLKLLTSEADLTGYPDQVTI